MNNTFKSQQITRDLEISVISAGPEYSLDTDVWAINWFNVKHKELYDLYNQLVASHVIKVKGGVFFKGRLKKRILGEDNDERGLLLIVNYPKPDNFLEMLRSKMFQLKSKVRAFAVKDFTFGFMKRLDNGEKPAKQLKKYDGKLIYMVHHYKHHHQAIDTGEMKEVAAGRDIFMHFSGIKSALLASKKTGKQLKTAPFLMDGMLIFGAFESSQLDDFVGSEFYQHFIDQNQSNYIALFNREL